jgi:hypothetical protein
MENTTDRINKIENEELAAFCLALFNEGVITDVGGVHLGKGAFASVDIYVPVPAGTFVLGEADEALHIALDGSGRFVWQDFNGPHMRLGNTAEAAADMIKLILKFPPGTFR